VEFFIGSTLLSSDFTSPYTAVWNTTTYTNGSYSLQTKAYDAAGNVGTSPLVNITVNNVTALGRISLSPVSLSFTGTSGGLAPAAKSVVLSNTGSAPLNWTASTNQSWCRVLPLSGSLPVSGSSSLTVSVDAPSTLGTFTCLITLASSNSDNSPQQLTVAYSVSSPVDTIPPTVSIVTSSFTNGTVARKTNVTLQAVASDNVAVSRVEFYVNNNLVCTDTTSSYTCLWAVPASNNATYQLTAKAYDARGNIGTSAAVNVVGR
jgi:hypothetical protein